MVRTCDRVPQKFVDVSCETVIFWALDILSKIYSCFSQVWLHDLYILC